MIYEPEFYSKEETKTFYLTALRQLEAMIWEKSVNHFLGDTVGVEIDTLKDKFIKLKAMMVARYPEGVNEHDSTPAE